MPRVVHFEIGVDNPERAKQFYEKIFGWKIEKYGPMDYWLIITGEKGEPGIDGALMKGEESKQNIVNTISVPSIDEFIERVKENGGKILMPKQTIPGIGYHTYCQDTEGNIFGIMEEDKTAK
ncbi:MAG: VOC family protein [Candidatus Aenigmarchaeota archaeon]|nr:VOC family protein [Candidatus Aenigmarchaeota archaeon]